MKPHYAIIHFAAQKPTTKYGSVPEWPKGADCKSVVFDFGGSNPPAPTKNPRSAERGFLLFHYYLFTLHFSLKYEDFWKVISNSE